MHKIALVGVTLFNLLAVAPVGLAMTPAPQVSPSAAKGWMDLPLTDVRTGKPFKLSDFAGKTVLVETMATWCSNCRRQLTNIKQVRPRLGENVVIVALSVENNLSDAALAQYAKAQGFDWTFAVATPEMIRELTAQFGRSVTTPSATPHFVIDAKGKVSELNTGIRSPEDLIAKLKPAS